MAIQIARLGSPRAPNEGVRIGTVRRPPRGVPKADFARCDFYDVWLPELAPSEALVKTAQVAETEENRSHRSLLRELLEEREAAFHGSPPLNRSS